MNRRKRSAMSRPVTFREFVDFKNELKDWIKNGFATKDWIEGRFATKDWIEERFATKDWIEERFATKDWIISHFANKQEFYELTLRVGRLEGRVDQLEDKMLTGFDKIYGSLEKLNQEFLFLHKAVLRIEEKI